MSINKPLVSILCPSFNHGKFIHGYIKSVLSQTFQNWELIIVDDCSSDNNISEINYFIDSRIHLFQQKFNMGINSALNCAFEKSTGDILVFLSSDDLFLPDYLENLVNKAKQYPNVGVFYSNLQCVDYEGEIIPNKILTNEQGNKYEILRILFTSHNCMLSPGMAIRRENFSSIYPLPIPMSQHQDYKMHIDLLLQTDFFVLDNISILYRFPSEKSGISFSSPSVTKRLELEESMLMDSFLKIKDPKIIRAIFPDKIEQFGTFNSDLIPYILGTLAMQLGKNESKKNWGYKQISSFLNNISNYRLLNSIYNFCYKNFLNLANYYNLQVVDKNKLKYIKYKKLFNCSLLLNVVIIFTLLIFL